jgi:hypothetical protein
MTSEAIDALVAAAFGDTTAVSEPDVPRLGRDFPQAIAFRQRGNTRLIFFQAVGEHFAEVDLAAVNKAMKAGHLAVVVAVGKGIKAIGPHFSKLKVPILCEIAGSPAIIDPPHAVHKATATPLPTTRVPLKLLTELRQFPGVPPALANDITELAKQYKRISRRKTDRDNPEAEALMEFARLQLIALGLEAHQLAGTAFIRSLEQAGLGGRRDHFFHSFQNYFLGLPVVAANLNHFNGFKDPAHVHWQVDPFAVWFLCAMWHDVGYAHEKVQSFINSAYGQDFDSGPAATAVRAAFIQQEKTSTSTRCIASLMARLLNPGTAKTEWAPPSEKTKLSVPAQGIYSAIIENLHESHGAFGGIRLYRDYAESMDSMEENQRQLAQQTVLLAASSMPFHDWKFRRAIRKALGSCCIPVHTLPFAALLAFVDSIQDDRRDLEGVLDTPWILKSVACAADGRITADVDLGALDSQSILEKIIEGRDVHASLIHRAGGMRFEYPGWILAAKTKLA